MERYSQGSLSRWLAQFRYRVSAWAGFSSRVGLLLIGILLVQPVWAADGATAVAPAHDKPGIDAVLIIDSSGSMKDTDPRRLRVPAAKMFISLLSDADRIGLVSFSDNGYPVVHLTQDTSANQAKLFAGVDKVSALGAYTNLYAAVQKGWEMLKQEGDPAHRRMLVLMSDGKMDVGDWDKDQALGKSIRDELIPELSKAGVEVYTIAFTEASDMALMRELANGTGGLARMASNDRELHGVFSTIFESAADPDMLPIDGGEFVVDGSVKEVTIVASKGEPNAEIYLVMPDGRQINHKVAGRAVRWFKSDQFDMITISDPPAGTWKLVSDTNDNRAYVVTNMGLEARLATDEVKVGQPVTVESWLQQGNETLQTPEVLTNTDFNLEVTDPDGKTTTIALNDKGENGDATAADAHFSHQVQFDQPGSYRLRAIAKAQTFQREKSLFVEVPPLPAGETAAPVAAPEPQPAPETKPEPEMTPPPPPPAAPMPEPAAKESPPEPKAGISIGMIVAIFVAINVVVGAAVGVFLFLRKRKRAKAGSAEEDAETADVDADEPDASDDDKA